MTILSVLDTTDLGNIENVYTAVLFDHSELGNISDSTDFGRELYEVCQCKSYWQSINGLRYLGEYSSGISLPLLFSNGVACSPKYDIKRRVAQEEKQKVFTLLSITNCYTLIRRKNVGIRLREALQTFERDPNKFVYVPTFGKTIEVVMTFSSTDTHMVILEKGRSWIVGKSQIPTWANVRSVGAKDMQRVVDLAYELSTQKHVDLLSGETKRLVVRCF